jgi:hypothetical protein
MSGPLVTAASAFISKLMTQPSKGFNDGLTAFGDFDVDSFINSNLEKAKGTPGTDLPKVTQGITRLLGLGPKPSWLDTSGDNSDSWYNPGGK